MKLRFHCMLFFAWFFTGVCFLVQGKPDPVIAATLSGLVEIQDTDSNKIGFLPTLISGKKIDVTIKGTEPFLESKGHYRIYRYGSISDGPVTVKIIADELKWFVLIIKDSDKLLAEASYRKGDATCAVNANVKAGDEIHIITGLDLPADKNTFSILLTEANRTKGQAEIDRAVESAKVHVGYSRQNIAAFQMEDARKDARKALSIINSTPGSWQSGNALIVLFDIAHVLFGSRDPETARTVFQKLLRSFEVMFPPDHPSLQRVRLDLAATLIELNDHQCAKDLLEKVLVMYRTRPPKDPMNLYKARMNLSVALFYHGELRRAKKVLEPALAYYEKHLPDDHIELQKARLNYALIIMDLDQLAESQSILISVLKVFEQALHPDDKLLQTARVNLATIYLEFGEFLQAKPYLEKATEVYSRILPRENTERQKAFLNLAYTFYNLGDYRAAEPIYEDVLDVYEKLLPPEHPDLQNCLLNLAMLKHDTGDFQNARQLEERVVEVYEKTFPEDSLELQRARVRLSELMYTLGDFYGAHGLLEKVVHVYKESYASDNFFLQDALIKLGKTKFRLDDFDNARTLFEKVLNEYGKVLSPDSLFLARAKSNLALIHKALGDLETAWDLENQCLTILEKTLLRGHPDLQQARVNLARTMMALRDYSGAKGLFQKTLDDRDKELTRTDPRYYSVMVDLSDSLMLLGEKKKAAELSEKVLNGVVRFILENAQIGSVREIDLYVLENRKILDHCLSLEIGDVFSPLRFFCAAETFRAAGIRAGVTWRIIARKGGENIRSLQNEIIKTSLKITSATGDNYYEAVRARDRAESNLSKALKALTNGDILTQRVTPEAIDDALPNDWIAVSFLRYMKKSYHPRSEKGILLTPSYLAFIVNKNGKVKRTNLGQANRIDQAVKTWQECLCQDKKGEEFAQATGSVKELIWKPVSRNLGNARNIIVAPDSVLASIPFEALSYKQGALADQYVFAYVESLTTPTMLENTQPGIDHSLVAFGDVDFDSIPRQFQEDLSNSTPNYSRRLLHSVYGKFTGSARGDWDVRARSLPYTKDEVEVVERLFSETYKKKALIITGPEASKASLVSLAPRAEYLHIATHGYFDPDIAKVLGKSDETVGSDLFTNRSNKVLGLTPSVLCGLKLAGYNLPQGTLKNNYVITAEEIQGLNLSSCRLAILSSCKSNVGIECAGKGIMSMQRALHVAGVKGSITSLWNVDDRAAWLLFTEFYRLLWDEKIHPAAALQKAKLWLRDLDLRQLNTLLDRFPSSMSRGLQADKLKEDFSKSDHPYSAPYFWAPFVYWGNVE